MLPVAQARIGEIEPFRSKTLAQSQAASPGDARAPWNQRGRSEESIGPFLCELPRVCEDDRDPPTG